MDLNALPMSEEEEEFSKTHSLENVAPQNSKETSVQILRREREERRERLKRNQVDSVPPLTGPSDLEEGPYTKKPKHGLHRLHPPEGWLDCPNFGHEIGYLIPSKVPLSESFNDYIVDKKRYSFQNVLSQLGHKLGMVVDLTNTDRYYRMNEVKEKGLKYLKIRCQGRDAIPDNEAVNIFVFEVAQFLYSQHDRRPRKYVFVHCTHGHNRTGYMIVHYLMRTQQASSVTEAIQIFAKSRRPGIYKEDYIDALYDFYHETKPDSVVCPLTPEWKRSNDLNQNSEALTEDDNGLSYSSIMKHNTIVRMTNDDILGDKIPAKQEYHLRGFCLDMLKPPGANTHFPGSHPVSLNRDNIQLLRQRYYYATWKADGTRYMMLLSPDGCYLIDRKFNCRRIQMRFPSRSRTKSQFHQYTLLDGEMVIDVSSQKQVRRYLIYDLMALNGISVVERPFSERWMMVEKEVMEPRNNDKKRLLELQTKPPYKYDLESFRVRRKDFWLLSTVPTILSKFISKLSHDADGLIFQGWDDPYVPKQHEGLLKWKYMNSVDFLFEIEDDGSEHLYLYEKGKKRLMEGNKVTFPDEVDSSSYSGNIIECKWDTRENVWVFMRSRTDKLTPNEFITYKKIMRSINDNITEDVLLTEIGNIIRLPMYADRIKNDTLAQKKGKLPPHGKS